MSVKWTFARGGAYYAVPCMRELPRRFVVCVGRNDGGVAFVFADDLAVGRLDVSGLVEGREFCMLSTKTARYNVSAASPVPVDQAAEVWDLINGVPS